MKLGRAMRKALGAAFAAESTEGTIVTAISLGDAEPISRRTAYALERMGLVHWFAGARWGASAALGKGWVYSIRTELGEKIVNDLNIPTVTYVEEA